MESRPDPVPGRGAHDNPANRFERIHYEPDSDAPAEEQPAPATHFFRDLSRSILTSNDSPDVGFEYSINPYRGCEHGCIYCLSGDTPILMADGTTCRLDQVRVGDEIYGTVRRGWFRHYARTRVLAHWSVVKPAYRIRLGDGTCLVAGADHRFLTARGWKYVTGGEQGTGRRPHLTINNKLMGVGAFASLLIEKAEDYKKGYLCGIIRGNGLLGEYAYENRRKGGGKRQVQFRLALVDRPALLRAAEYLRELGVPTQRFIFQKATTSTKQMDAIRTNVHQRVKIVRELVAWPPLPSVDWSKGFLAGIFDAEGSYSDGIVRIPNTDAEIISHITQSLKRFGFPFAVEHLIRGPDRAIGVVRLCGGLREHLRFFHTTDPAILRKRDIEGQAVKNAADLRVTSIEPLGVALPLFDITTGTGDFIANGVVSHNCFARPTHEYLGFSAGLDFESKIMVKEDAPALLRKELAAPRWRPCVVAVSGVTDCYQPAERRFRLTRRCLEVFAEFRNPVGVVTKNRLVTRDSDLLAELAQHEAAAVFLSVTTLDAELAGNLEPRATRPQGRLAAIRELTAAGIPVGVLVAPVIPGLTDHEMPAILEAAVAAGAQFAGYVPLRLPYAVGPLFEAWLERHYPAKKEKVLSRIRELRGGRLNDSNFGSRMTGEGTYAEQIRALFTLACRKTGIAGNRPRLSTAAFRRPGGTQRTLFE
jgi:DNA repair photolyase